MTKLLATDLIIASRPGDPTTILAHLDTPDDLDKTYVRAMKTWCAAAGIDPFIALSQWAVETANGTSVRWVRDHNPGGVGIPADSTVQPFEIANGDEAARIHVQALYACMKEKPHPDVPIPIAAIPWFDEIWLPKVKHPNYPGVTIVDDLNTRYTANGDAHSTWAWDAEYITTLISRCSVMYPELQPQATGGTIVPQETPPTFGLVPHPAYQNRQIWKTEGVGMNNLGKRTVKGVSWHRILGSLWGTDTYFRSPSVAALTDYGVGVTDEDGATHDGEILRWNDPLGYQSGWASGTYSSYAYGDGAAFVNKYGVNAINRDRASIEISGFQGTALSPKAKQSIAAITAYWADQYQVPWHTFPNVPWDGFSFVVWHEEFGPDQGQKKCPFDVVKAATAELINMTAAILKHYQDQPVTQDPPPPSGTYATPITYPWLAINDGKVHKVGGTRVLPLTLTYTATKATPRYQKGSKTSEKIGPNITKGTTFKADRVFRSPDGITWVMTRFGTRVLASALTPRVGVTASGRISVRNDEAGEPEVISDNVEGTA